MNYLIAFLIGASIILIISQFAKDWKDNIYLKRWELKNIKIYKKY